MKMKNSYLEQWTGDSAKVIKIFHSNFLAHTFRKHLSINKNLLSAESAFAWMFTRRSWKFKRVIQPWDNNCEETANFMRRQFSTTFHIYNSLGASHFNFDLNCWSLNWKLLRIEIEVFTKSFSFCLRNFCNTATAAEA